MKKLFSIEEDIIGFPILCCLLHESGKLEYIPVPLFSSTSKQPAARIQVRESFSLSETRTEQISSVISSVFLILCSVYVLWNQTEFELFYQIIAVIMLLFFVPNLFHNLFWKVTVDYHSISIRRFPFLVKTYEIRQITAVVETQNHITLYAGPKRWLKLQKQAKTFPIYLSGSFGLRHRYTQNRKMARFWGHALFYHIFTENSFSSALSDLSQTISADRLPHTVVVVVRCDSVAQFPDILGRVSHSHRQSCCLQHRPVIVRIPDGDRLSHCYTKM